jgi:hypothetical protein
MQNKTADYLSDYMTDTFIKKIGNISEDWATDNIIESPQKSFRIIFSLYNYFTIDVEYNDGKFEWYNYVDEKLISLNNHKQYDAEKDIDLFIAELLKTMKTRIPAKYLKFYEKKGFYSSKTWMD